MHPVKLSDVLKAKKVIKNYLPCTPLINYPALDQAVGARVLVKHENHQPVGAFKVRGGVYLISQLSEAKRGRGVISASTGNHGQSIAYGARLFGVKAAIVVPEGANPLKVASMRNLGAEVIHYGADFDTARGHCEQVALERGMRYVHSANEPMLLAGVGTIALEILEEAPDIDTLIVPVGAGSGVSSACVVARAIKPGLEIIGVQSEESPAAYNSWRQRQLLTAENKTVAEGLATAAGFELPQRIMWEDLNDFVLIKDSEIPAAIRLYIEAAHSLAEGAGAASLAAALKLRERLAGKTVALVLSGGNITLSQLQNALTNR